MNDSTTVGEALRLHYAASGLPDDGGRSAERWVLKLGPLTLTLRNFAWRRRALRHHDVHHLVTGYPCTPAGEMEMAAWEFAAGRFPNLLSTLFCLPLVGIGACVIPRRAFAAFTRGRRSKTLYASSSAHDELMALPLRTVQSRLLSGDRHSLPLRDRFAYACLVAVSLCLIVAPLAVLVTALT
jgi:hypothetical protein